MKLAFLLAGFTCLGQAQQRFRVSLEVTPESIQFASMGIEVQAAAGGNLTARLPGGGEMRLERMTGPVMGFIAHIPGADPETLAFVNDQFSKVTLKRTVGNLQSATYLLGYHRSERDGKAVEAFLWAPTY